MLTTWNHCSRRMLTWPSAPVCGEHANAGSSSTLKIDVRLGFDTIAKAQEALQRLIYAGSSGIFEQQLEDMGVIKANVSLQTFFRTVGLRSICRGSGAQWCNVRAISLATFIPSSTSSYKPAGSKPACGPP